MRRLGFQERAAEVIEEGWWAEGFMNPEPRRARNAKKITSRWMRVIPQATMRCDSGEDPGSGWPRTGTQQRREGEEGLEWNGTSRS